MNKSAQTSRRRYTINSILIFLVVTALVAVPAFIESRQSKEDLLELMANQSHNLLESLLVSSRNSLIASEEINYEIEERLLNNAYYVRELYDYGRITNRTLARIAAANHIFRINIFNRSGERIYYSHDHQHSALPEQFSPADSLQPIFYGTADTLIWGLRRARFSEEMRYSIAIAARDRSAIVINLDAAEIIELRKITGFGTLLKNVIRHPGIIYAALQDTSAILAAAGDIGQVEGIRNSPFLINAYAHLAFNERIALFDSLQVYEVVHPFVYDGQTVGLFRLGLSLQPLEALNARIARRLFIMTIVMAAAGMALFLLIRVRQNLHVLRKRYQEIETWSSSIIEQVSDAILIIDHRSRILLINAAAEKLFHRRRHSVVRQPLPTLIDDPACRRLMTGAGPLQQFECLIEGRKKYLLASRSEFSDHDQQQASIIVIRDLTRQKEIERQVQRKERLTAMGELASGVAHEIRNPLNTIGTIAQQLDSDFEPSAGSDEYHELAGLIYREVRRINQTVSDFLRFARPQPTHPQYFELAGLISQVRQQYRHMLDQQHIHLEVDLQWEGQVYWDRGQMQQVLMNLIQNAIDATGEGGRIAISTGFAAEEYVELRVSDDGPGIPAAARSRIFNLYFTSKAGGTGIGLSIVQRIVDEHGGVIAVESAEKGGSTFVLKIHPLPFHPNSEVNHGEASLHSAD